MKNPFEIKSKNLVVTELLTLSKTYVEDMVNRIEENYNNEPLNKKYGRLFTEFDRIITRYTLVRDFVKSVEKYTEVTDTLVKHELRYSKGTLVITSQIKRDEVVHFLNTEVIYAGGHNIQRLHYRYITLPKQI